MKKQAIFILDPKTEKLIGVCDIKSLTIEQFINFQNESKRNLADKLQLENFVEQEKNREFNNKILELQNEINDYVTTKGYVNNKINSALTSVYKIAGTRDVSYLNNLSKSSLLNGNVFNLMDSGSLLNADSTQVSVYVGDNVLFIWNGGSWYWDKLANEFDTSNFAKLDGDNRFTGSENTFTGVISDGSSQATTTEIIATINNRFYKHRFLVSIGSWYLNFDCIGN